MKTFLNTFTATLLLLTAISCQKKPNASFSTDKEIYNTDETVRISDNSSDAYFYTWTVKGPGGYEDKSSGKEYSFIPAAVGDYEISLLVYSKDGKVSSRSEKTISSKTPVTSYIFFTDVLDGTFYKSVSVYVDNVYIGNITTNCSYRPACGDVKGLTTNIKSGTHDIRFSFYPYNLNKNFNGVMLNSNNPCNTWEIMN